MSVSLKYRLEYLALHSLYRYVNSLPADRVHQFGRRFGAAVGHLWRARKRIAISNLTRAFPEKDTNEIRTLADRVFENIGQTAFEVLRFPHPDTKDLFDHIEFEGIEHLDRVAQGGTGALLMSGHLGNWELLGALIHTMGYPVDLIVKPLRNPLTDVLINDCRSASGVGLIRTQNETSGIVRALRSRRLVAILADQNAGREGVSVDFFGRIVSTPKGPAALSLRYGCPIIMGCLIHRPDGTHAVHIDPPFEFEPSGDTERDIVELTQIYTRRIEDYVRAWPDQWLWTHRRWGKGG